MRASGHNNDDDQRPSGEALDGAAAPSIRQEIGQQPLHCTAATEPEPADSCWSTVSASESA
jgi:hypothetical protein